MKPRLLLKVIFMLNYWYSLHIYKWHNRNFQRELSRTIFEQSTYGITPIVRTARADSFAISVSYMKIDIIKVARSVRATS